MKRILVCLALTLALSGCQKPGSMSSKKGEPELQGAKEIADATKPQMKDYALCAKAYFIKNKDNPGDMGALASGAITHCGKERQALKDGTKAEFNRQNPNHPQREVIGEYVAERIAMKADEGVREVLMNEFLMYRGKYTMPKK